LSFTGDNGEGEKKRKGKKGLGESDRASKRVFFIGKENEKGRRRKIRK
jgi:hypothetical protein